MISYTPPSETSSSSPPPVPPSEVGRTPDASRALAPSHHRSPPGAFGSIGSRLPPARSCESDPMETATQTLHRLTSYAPELEWDIPIDDPRVVADFVSTDIDRFPWFYKRYEQELPRTDLPRDLRATTAPAVAVLAGTADVTPADLDLAQLSRLLHLSAGVVRTT